ncbi:hypothetical protein HDR59_04305 [bacterium]|nr:hypothetical protein [bacterium]
MKNNIMMFFKKNIDEKSNKNLDKVDNVFDLEKAKIQHYNKQLVTGKILSFLISVDMFAIMLFKGRNQAITDKLVFAGTVLSFANIVMLGSYKKTLGDEKMKLPKKKGIDLEIDNIVKKSSEGHKKFQKLLSEMHLIKNK